MAFKAYTRRFKKLFKQGSSADKVLEWQIWVDVTKKDVTINTQYGQRGGKQVTTSEVISSGKNIGRANETTPEQQALSEAMSRWRVKLERHNYTKTIADCNESRSRAPMLAHIYEDHSHKVDWDNAYVQPKLDGFRCTAVCDRKGQVRLLSRQGKPILAMHHITEKLGTILRKGDVLDGELYIHGKTFQDLSSMIKKYQQDISDKVRYHVYDCPLADKSFQERWDRAVAMLKGAGLPIVLVKTTKVTNHEAAQKALDKYLEQGYEGAILRHGTASYAFGKRSSNLLKLKKFIDAEFKITGAKLGRGKCAKQCIFLCETAEGAVFEVIAPGTAKERTAAWTNKANYIGKKLTVKYQEMTTSEQPVPRFPVALRLYDEL